MKLRMKILSTIMSMSLAIGVMAFAVFAASTQTLTVTNTVNFQSDHVLATIEGLVTGTDNDYDQLLETGNENLVYSGSVDNSTAPTNVFAAWTIGDITPGDQDEAIVYTITITNNNLERSFDIVFTGVVQLWNFAGDGESDITNVTRALFYDYVDGVGTVWNGTDPQPLDAGASVVIRITVLVTDPGVSVDSFDNGFTITLTDETLND